MLGGLSELVGSWAGQFCLRDHGLAVWAEFLAKSGGGVGRPDRRLLKATEF